MSEASREVTNITEELRLNEEVKMGPGLTRVNVTVLEDELNLFKARKELSRMLDQIPLDWDAHTRLEYMKVSIRTVILIIAGSSKRQINNDIIKVEVS